MAWAEMITVGLALALQVVAPTAAQIEADRKACKHACTRTEDEGTDRTTCELVCDTRADNRLEGPSVTRWTTEKQMGGPTPGTPLGHPDDNSGQTTTTRTVTTTRSPASTTPPPPPSVSGTAGQPKARVGSGNARRAVASPAWRTRAPLAACQSRCRATQDRLRWACKLQCLKQPQPATSVPVPVAVPLGAKASTTTTTTTTRTSNASPTRRPAATCNDECAGVAAGDDRSTCLARCTNRGERTEIRNHGTRKVGDSDAKASTTACNNTCGAQANACRSACTEAGSDRATCRLQCDQSERGCRRRC